MTVHDQIIELLRSHKIKYQHLKHEPVKTCQDAAKIRGTSPDQGAKALVCFTDNKPIMIVLPCSRKIDFRLFKSLFHIKDLRLATPAEVLSLTSLEIGSIPPLGTLFSLPTYVDSSLSTQSQIAFNAGDHSRSVTMSFSDFAKINPATQADFSSTNAI